MLRYAAILIALLAFIAPSSSAHADDKDDAPANIKEGDRLFRKGKFDRALAKYREAYKIYDSPQSYYPIAISP